ncbi:atrial natriuretic peptide-converting enzyme isoform X2 [Dendroctonus ponderosae]|uniref:Atrial natriuretic peptide-converting enzyme n=1 Tax=Dendroctonus ponderosae TaxID=77166 RepID=A0AAR5PWV4_DENPD|nr:atrial natriuretic peptide-converting enzyme isoform X2 [Dendroctonus ponderosae]
MMESKMLDRHRNSFSQVEGPHGYQRWNVSTASNENTLIDLVNTDTEIVNNSLKLAPVNSSNIYARRHSAHACTATEDRQLTVDVSSQPPPIPLRPPPVPKRTIPVLYSPLTPPTPPIPQHSPPLNPNVRKKFPQPPPLPPTPKTRAPPFNQLLPSHKPCLPSIEQTKDYRKSDVNRNANTNFPFDNIKPTDSVKRSNMNNINRQEACKPSTPNRMYKPNQQGKISMRQDSGISTDSFSQNSSPSYTTKGMDTPLLPPKTHLYKSQNGVLIAKLKDIKAEDNLEEVNGITKSVSTPAGLQTVVRFHNGSNMSVHHKILRESRRPSESYNHRFFFKFRFIQLLVNAVALFAIGAGIVVYFRALAANPSNVVTIVNRTINVTALPISSDHLDGNPAKGVCLPVIVKFCLQHQLPYNYTIYPNYVGHFGQRDAQMDLEIYDAVVDVRCYELASLFLCTIFVPKCGPHGMLVRPCKSMCLETYRRCGFFLDVFGLSLPKYLECELFPESSDPNVCIGHAEVKALKIRESKPICPSGFQCDVKRCIPKDWHCDGHVDCKDQTDELNCKKCGKDMIHCGFNRCISQQHMCDGITDCPWGQDERNCLRLSERNGDEGVGRLEVFRPEKQNWVQACLSAKKDYSMYNTLCNKLGYLNQNSTIQTNYDNHTVLEGTFQYTAKTIENFNIIDKFATCGEGNSTTIDLVCTKYVCGRARVSNGEEMKSTRIVGGVPSRPGDWPFLAALLGGPEEVFYCAGVLIADQWVLTASHCVGNHSDVSGWTIQLGITRRHSHSFYGQKMKVKRVVPHPLYNIGVAHDNDVALFQLSSRVTYHEHLSPVCLPEPDTPVPNDMICTVIGWGKKEDTGKYEPEINEVEVPVVEQSICNHWLQYRELNVTTGMICAGYKNGGKDACQGDSGGPLLCRLPEDRNRWFVGGIVSWGIKCAHPHLPGVYAFVPKYVDWINAQMEEYSE